MQDGPMDAESRGDGDGFGRVVASFEERVGPRIEQARQALESINAKALRVLREYPGTSLIVAVGVGFLIGRLASRR